MQRVSFKNRNIIMAGSLCQPRDFKDGARYPAVVVVHPAGGVKEQTAGEYAKRLAAEGFVTLAFDTSYQGESGGEPRYLDEPMNRVGDIYVRGPWLVLEADPPVVDAGSDVTLALFGGASGGALALLVVDRDGVAALDVLLFDAFDAAGAWTASDTVPPELAGSTWSFLAFGYVPTGKAQGSNVVAIRFE